jgi:RinA family phage transcriptional activator
MTDDDAKKLMAEILKRAYEDYINPPYDDVNQEDEKSDVYAEKKRIFNDAKKFIHSAWCATLCDGIGVNTQAYIDKTIDRCRLTKNVTRFIVGELRAFEANKKVIDGVKDDIILAGAEQNEIRSTSPGNTTLSKVIQIDKKIYSDKQLRQTQSIVNAIQTVYNRLDKGKKELLDNCFFKQRYTIDGMAYKLNIDRATAYRWKISIVRDIAIKLGYL